MNMAIRVALVAAAFTLPLAAAGCGNGDGSQQGHVHSQEAEAAPLGHHEPSGTLENGVRVVKVTARQYEFDPSEVVVNQGDQVRLEVTATDVEHGLAIADYDIDRKLEPGKTETIEFVADKAGSHPFHCSVYCGSGHREMTGNLIVLPRPGGAF